MFISALELFKVGIGPSSSHTLGPMVAASDFINLIKSENLLSLKHNRLSIRCTLKGSLAFTGKGHATDRAICLGLHEYSPNGLVNKDITALIDQIWNKDSIVVDDNTVIYFTADNDIVFDKGKPLQEHPNGMVFDLLDKEKGVLFSETYFSIGGGFINTLAQINQLQAPLKMKSLDLCKYPFSSAEDMLYMANKYNVSIAHMKKVNELDYIDENSLNKGLDNIWQSMKTCVEKGLNTDGELPGGLGIQRRAKGLFQKLKNISSNSNINDWLCTYAMAVNEENAAGNMVVTAPTNGAAGVVPAVIYYFITHENGTKEQVRNFLLVASAIGGLIKHNSSISGAEVGCQGEVGSAAAMAAAGLCSALGGTSKQIENAAEIALEHHLGMTCDPVNGLVQVPCIERNGFGAIKAYTAASLALHGDGSHFMPLDNCIEAMKQTGLEMSHKYKETSLGGLAVSITEC